MSYQNIGAEKFKELMEDNDAVVLDVRAPNEYAEGQIEGHTLINFFEPDFRDEIDKLDRSKTYLIYCRSGNRSGQACMMMGDMGFEKLYNLDGGIGAWNAMNGQ